MTNVAQVLIVGRRPANRVAGAWICQICQAALTLLAAVSARLHDAAKPQIANAQNQKATAHSSATNKSGYFADRQEWQIGVKVAAPSAGVWARNFICDGVPDDGKDVRRLIMAGSGD